MAGWSQGTESNLYADWNAQATAYASGGWDQYAGYSTGAGYPTTGSATQPVYSSGGYTTQGYSTQGYTTQGYDAQAALKQSSVLNSSWGIPPPPAPASNGGGWGSSDYGVRGGRGRSDYGGRGRGGSDYGRGGRGGSRFAAYETSRSRDMRTDRGVKRPADGDTDGEVKRPRYKGRVGREPELVVCTDPRFRYWDLSAKARVLLVSNLPLILKNPDKLYNLFSFYGDVDRIKITRRKSDCALIEFSTASFAAIARDNLDNYEFRGTKMVISFSKFDRVRLPMEMGAPDDGLTKDFTGTEYRKTKRYSTEELKKGNLRKVVAPTNLLHLIGIEGNSSPNVIKKNLMNGTDVSIVDIIGVEMKKSKKAALDPASKPKLFYYVQFGSVDDALVSMAFFGNVQGMKFSFSKDQMNAVRKNFEEKKIKVLTEDQVL